ncbi:conjugal transfer protein TraL [Legionella birminghamensis]|uniref:Conjugal transfer protein TraL n=1 Tax=Legionella birminghamensis TaxID=28083 RepID=A0A378JQD3_9GAMM|nr:MULTISPECIES: ArsA-related P-loop ATPase [Legionella]KTC71789.1 conjugal transfer protein TraL [Legionella birminghamensis]MCW8452572.1 conjugal transfer protein TraL [Legionella quinlivanii]STX60855.1 TraL Protein [Legionella birminghamensis]
MKIHITMQGKGGVGKSFVSAITAQYKIQKGQNPLCIDTDPINATFHGFKALNVQRLEIMEGDEINSRHFDLLIERIAPTKEDVVIDNGASSFVPLSHYLISNQVPSLLKELGHDLVIHTVITGGQALLDTVHGFSQLIHQFSKEIHFVVWLNPYWGAVTYDGKDFEQMKVYRDHKERIASLIHIPALKEETYGRDLTDMLQKRITFNEALNDAHNNIMTRQRLKIIRDQLFDQLNNAVVI